MAIEEAYFETVLQEALTERDTQLQEKQLPEINIGEAIPITEGLDFADEYVEYGITEVLGSVKDGIIGNKTNSMVTIDSTIEMYKAPVCQWAKAVVWTQQELEKINKININLQSKKQKAKSKKQKAKSKKQKAKSKKQKAKSKKQKAKSKKQKAKSKKQKAKSKKQKAKSKKQKAKSKKQKAKSKKQKAKSKKQDDLYANALSTLQYAGYLGHNKVKGQEGLLTGSKIQVMQEESGKSLKDLSANEFIKLVLDAYNKAWANSDYRVQPTHIAMDAADFMLAMQKFDSQSPIVGTDLLPVSAMDRIMAALRKASGNDSFTITFVKVPAGYAKEITKGKTRLAIYTYDEEYVEMKVHMPELLAVRQRDLLTYECGYRSAFGGAMWKQPLSAVYADYKTAPKS